MHQVGLGGQAEVDVLQTDVAVDDTSADDGGDGNAKCNLLHERAGGDQGRGMHSSADVVVDDHTSSQVQADLKALEHEQRLLKVLRSLHLGDQTEEGDVSTIGKDDVGDSLESSVQVGLDGGLDDATRVLLNADGDHGDQNCAEDTEERGKRDPGHALHGTGDGQHQRDEHTNKSKDNRASAVVGNGVHHDAEGQDVATHDENAEQELASAEEFTANRAKQNLTSVRQVLNVRVPFTHQSNVVSGICCQKTQANNQNNTTTRFQV